MKERIVYIVLGVSTFLNILLIFSYFFNENNLSTGEELVLRKDVREVSLEDLQNLGDDDSLMDENILFLGDSITDFYDLKKYYGDYHVVNSGVDGNTVYNILDDMENRVYQYNPSKVFLLIGTNQINQESVMEVYDSIRELVSLIRKNRQYAHIYLESVYPVNDDSKHQWMVRGRENKKIEELNLLLRKYADTDIKLTYVDVYSKLLMDGELNEKYTKDGLHLNDKGYQVVTDVLKKYM